MARYIASRTSAAEKAAHAAYTFRPGDPNDRRERVQQRAAELRRDDWMLSFPRSVAQAEAEISAEEAN